VHILELGYVFRGEQAAIHRFLAKHPFLIPLLSEASIEIANHFPRPLLSLAVATDPEEFIADQLVVSIVTTLNPGEAVAALHRFDKAWWLNSVKRSQGKLCITLECI